MTDAHYQAVVRRVLDPSADEDNEAGRADASDDIRGRFWRLIESAQREGAQSERLASRLAELLQRVTEEIAHTRRMRHELDASIAASRLTLGATAAPKEDQA